MDRRRQAWRLLGSPMQLPTPASDSDSPEEAEREVVDGFAFDYAHEPRCLVCSSPPNLCNRVDQLLVRGETYQQILRAIDSQQEESTARRISYHSIRRHQQRHLTADELAVRAVLERRARERGQQIVLGDSPIITNAGTLEVIRNAGFESIATGALFPTIRETIQAAVALEQIDQSSSEVDVDELSRQAQILIDLVQERLPEDQWASLAADFEARVAQRPGPSESIEDERPAP